MLRRGLIWLAVGWLSACASQGEGTESGPDGPDEGTDGTEITIPDNGDNLVALSSAKGPEGVLFQAIAVSNGYVWACTGAHGLHVSKIGGGASLSVAVEQGSLGDAQGCRDVRAAPDGAVFVAGQSAEGSFLSQIDNTPGDDVSVLSTAKVDGLVESIVASDTHVFAAVGEGGLRIFARGDGSLTEVAHLAAGFDQTLGVALWGADKLVVANGLSGLVVVDIADPASPKILDSHEAYGTSRRVEMVGDHAYVASVAGGIGIYNLAANKVYPPMGGWATHGSSIDLTVADGKIYVANLDDLCVLDASNPAKPVLLGSERVGATGASNPRVADIAVHNGVAYVAEWSGIWSYSYVADREAPDIHLSKTSLDFGIVGLKKGKGIIIKNLGQEALTIESVSVTNELFSFDDEDAKKILPGDTGFLQVVFEAVDDEPVEGFLVMKTNDPDEAEIKMPLKANSLDGIQLGAPFDNDGELIYQEYKNGNNITVKQAHAGKVVLLAYFATW